MKHSFQSFWAGETLSPYEMLCLRSFIDHGHRFELYTFEPDLRVPAGVELRDASEIIGREQFFVYEDGPGKGSPAAFANLFRYKLLAEKGGWWVDTDVLCLSGDIPQFTEFFAAEDDTLINVAILRFPPGHPLMVRCLEQARRMGRTVRWGDTGPYLLTRLVHELGYHDHTLPPEIGYPLHHSHAVDILRPSRCAGLVERTKHAPFVHLYNASLLLRGVQKDKAPPAGSLLQRWIAQHPVDGWNGGYDEGTVERTLVAL
jgi:hypothetical protein